MHGIIELESVRILVANSNIAVLHNCIAHVIVHCTGFLIAYPSVNTSSAREYPQKVIEVKVLVERVLDHVHCDFEVGETTLANIGALAASPHIIIVVHINIEHHLFLHGHEGLFIACVVAIWRNIINGSNINLVWDFIDERLPEVLSIFEAKVTTVNIVSKGETKLALVEVGGVSAVVEAHQGLMVALHHLAIADPFEHELEGEDALVVNLEPVWVKLQLYSTVVVIGSSLGLSFVRQIEV